MVVPVGANFQAQLDLESGAKPVILVQMNFTTGVRRFAMWPYDVTFSGDTFLGLGPVAGIDTAEWSVESSADRNVPGVLRPEQP